MAIVVEHQPVDAMYSLAQKAGTAEYMKQQQMNQERKQLLRMQQEHQQRQQEFMVRAEQAARAEEMQYQVLLLQARRNVDMQLETARYAKQKQELQQTIDMISQSDELSDSEKEELKIQATAKFAGVGTGISPSSFSSKANKQLQNTVLLGAYKAKVLDDIQDRVDRREITAQQGQNEAAVAGLTGVKIYDPDEKAEMLVDRKFKRLTTVTDAYNKSFFTDKKGRPYDAETEEPIREGTPKYEQWQTMKREVKEARESVSEIRGALADLELWDKFQRDLAVTPEYQQLVKELGAEKAFEEYKKHQPKSSSYQPKKEPGLFKKVSRHPIMDVLMGQNPVIGQQWTAMRYGQKYIPKAIEQIKDPQSGLNRKLREAGYGD